MKWGEPLKRLFLFSLALTLFLCACSQNHGSKETSEPLSSTIERTTASRSSTTTAGITPTSKESEGYRTGYTTPPTTAPRTAPKTEQPNTTVTRKPPTTIPPRSETTVPAESAAPSWSTAADTAQVEQRVLYYINAYRRDQNVSTAEPLPGLTAYARYRSRQIVSNFSHDEDDARAAATALKYGQYIDPADIGETGQPYYRVSAREAIAKTGRVGTVDEVAKALADLFRNSAGHWGYVGAERNGYIGIGVTYAGSLWHCSVSVSADDIG